MNSQQIGGDQFIQLQNLAYIKQFLRKGSIKVMMVASFISAFLSGFVFFQFGSLMNFAKELLILSNSTTDMESFTKTMELVAPMTTIMGIVAIIFNLIFPITLLAIIVRAHNEEPTAVPKGAVTFLYVLSIIGLVLAAIGAVCNLISSIIQLFSGNASADSNAVASLIGSIISCFITCLYPIFQFQFIGSVRKSINGQALVSEGSQGYGVFSVLYAVFGGIVSVFLLVFYVIFTSISSSTDPTMPYNLSQLIASGVLSGIMNYFLIILIACVVSTVYYIAAAATAFGFKNTITEAVKASYTVQNSRANGTNNSPFRTYGGSNSYSNYNYSNTGTGSQQSYQADNNAAGSKEEIYR